MFFLHLPLPTKLRTFHWPSNLEHSIGNQAWNIPLATKFRTFHWPPSLEHSIGHQALDLPSPFFFFSLKGRFRSLEALSFLKHNFQFNVEYIYSHKLLKEEENDQLW